MSRPRDRMSSERHRARGQIGKRRAQLDPIWRENRDVRSGLWPKPAMAKAKVPSAAVRPTLHLIRGKPRSGRIGGVAARLVTFLWPRKEKLLAPARRAGEIPSRPAASRPARRSRAINYPLGRLRLPANRPYDCTAQPCLLATGTESGQTPGCHRQRGRGHPYRPRKGSQSLNTGCNPACRTAAATSPTGRSS